MPPKRAAAVSQALQLSNQSSHDDVLAFLSSVLTTEQYSRVTESWAEFDEPPTGADLLNSQKADLRTKFSLPSSIANKVDQHLKAIRLAQTSGDENSPRQMTTPLVDTAAPAPQELDLQTSAPTVPKARGRGRPPKARQSRLSQRLEAPPQDEDMEDAAEEESHSPLPGRCRTRQHESKVAAVQRAQARIEEANDEYILDEQLSDGAPSDTESELEEEVAPRSRGPRAQRVTLDDVEDEEEDSPDTPDDGIHPKHNDKHFWKDAAREGLYDMLKMLSFDELKDIVDDYILGNPFHYYKYRSKDSHGIQTIKNRSRGFIAAKIIKYTMDGQLNAGVSEDGGCTWEGVDEIIEKFVPVVFQKKYLNNILKPRFHSTPKLSNPRDLIWRLWTQPAALEGPDVAVLGQITFPVIHLGNYLLDEWNKTSDRWEPQDQRPWITTQVVNAAYMKGKEAIANHEANIAAHAAHGLMVAENLPGSETIKLEDGTYIKPEPGTESSAPLPEIVFAKSNAADQDWDDLFEQLRNLHRQGGINIRWRVQIRGKKTKKLLAEVTIDMKNRGEALVHAAFLRKTNEGNELIQVWLDKILQAMDHLQGTDVLEEKLEALNAAWDAAIDDMENCGIAINCLEPPQEMDIKLFDRIMAGLENLDRPMEDGVEEECEEKIALKLKTYQKRALSFMLREERAPGGTARHLWLKVPLPGEEQSGFHCYMSPSLFQLYVSKSATAAGVTLGNTGGGGWQALEMGMGKTAVVLAGILMNPTPANWYRNRPWKPYDSSDYMLTKTENMPRGGTLVVVPNTLIRQWEMEIEKTLDNPQELSVLRWTDSKRSLDCKEIGKYDIVLTTPSQATKCMTLSSIYWHRIVIDEAQQIGASMMQSGLFISTHRWIVSGTPCNAHPQTMLPSLEFLRLGGYSTAQRHIPSALSTVLRAVMLRYTIQGTIDGEKNLELPPLVQRAVAITLDDDDAEDEKVHKRKTYSDFRGRVLKTMRAAGVPNEVSVDQMLADREQLKQLSRNNPSFGAGKKGGPLKKMVATMRGIVAGGTPVQIPGKFTQDREGNITPATRYFQSKAQAVVACLEQLRTSDRDAKVLVFSEFEETLRSIAALLPEIGLDHRMIVGSTSMKKRGEAIEQFANDPPTRVFLLAARTAAVGITLTAATHVYICEPLLNPSLELQAIGRSRRMGQTKTVTVTRLYCKGTIEEKVRDFMRQRHSKMESTAMAVNAEAVEIHCNAADYNTLLECNLDDSDDEGEDFVAMAD